MKRFLVLTFAAIMAVLALANGGLALAATPNYSQGTYAALGDSVAAGQGLAPFASPTAADTLCGRSAQAYPTQVADSLGLKLKFIACSSAKASDLVNRQHIGEDSLKPQIKAAFAKGNPQLISITVGANDIHWGEFIAKCSTSSCGSAQDDREANALIRALEFKLRYAMIDILVRSHGHPPRVLLTGYYNAFSPVCTLVQKDLTAQELNWLESKRARLNNAIQDVAGSLPSARFVPIDFSGHDVCSTDPWLRLPGTYASLHPTPQGQAAIARALVTAAD